MSRVCRSMTPQLPGSSAMRIPQLAVPVSASVRTSAIRSVPEWAGNSPIQAAIALEEFLAQGRATVVLSGAGISVDSNIPDYRGMLVTRSIVDSPKGPLEHILSTINIVRSSSMNSLLKTKLGEDIGIPLKIRG